MSTSQVWFLVAAMSLLGLAVGYAIPTVLAPPAPEVVTETKVEVVEEELTDDEIAEMCARRATPSDKERIEDAMSQVEALSSALEDRELELAALQAERKRGKEAGQRLAARIQELESEVETLREELVVVKDARDQLMVELKETVKRLDHQIQETEKYKRAARKWKKRSTENLWRSFKAEVKVTICDRGTRKRHEKCHAAIDEALTPAIEDQFESCVDTYQAVPVLGQLESRKDTMPAFAVALPDERVFPGKGWYIDMCDPTLPEPNQGEAL